MNHFPDRVGLFTIPLLAFLAAWPWQAAAQWNLVTNGAPSARGYAPATEDTARSRLVMFGGTPDGTAALRDTWEWSEANGPWQQVALSGPQPPARFVHASAYWSNGVTGHVVIFGGLDGSSHVLSDTWLWSGTTWQQATNIGPSGRFLAAMAPEPARQRALLFGGAISSGYLGDTWIWNGVSWSQLAVTGPSARAAHAMAYDSARDRIVLFGGEGPTGYRGDTWEWNGAAWTLRSTNGPPARRDHALAHKGNRIVLYGGLDTNNAVLADTWQWDGTNWTQMATGCPPARNAHAMAEETAAGDILLYGGSGATTVYSDTWRDAVSLGSDAFAGRVPLCGNFVAFLASTIGATHETDEPLHTAFDSTDLGTVWYSWTAPSAGGVDLEAFSDVNIFQPMLAVYMGNILTNLTKIADDIGSFNHARVAFSAVSNQTYQIVVDASDGFVTNVLVLSPPPTNDLFANAIPITGTFYTNAGSFLGASREPGEPSHGDTNLAQTLWWTWTAPTNMGVVTSPVNLLADAVSFPPGLGVYTGSTVSNLTNVALTTQSNGMTRMAGFTATAGTTYRIALAGSQWPAPNGQNVLISPQYGNYRFRLDQRALVLTVSNSPAVSTNGDGSVNFTADLTITNQGAATSNPLQVWLTAISGVSVKSSNTMSYLVNGTNFVSTSSNLSVWTPSPSTLAPTQRARLHVNGVAPAPVNDPNQQFGIGYGVYAELLEQAVPGRWFAVDQVLLLFDQWPSVGGFAGPGGGVIRLDPFAGGGAPFNPLISVAVLGPLTVPEGSSANYTGRSFFADGTFAYFTNTAWTAPPFSITSNGVFTAGSVTTDTVVTITAPYSYVGYQFSSATNITVLNLPPPKFTGIKVLSNGLLSLTVSTVPGRSNALEATTNLSPAIWVPVFTNSSTNGVLNFTDPSRTNLPRRFYRAREL